MQYERSGNPRTYRGIQMKSRGEARFAALCDYQNVSWKYEAERIGKLGYLPDFFFPEVNVYVEIKPPNISFSELAKFYLTAEELALTGDFGEIINGFAVIYVNSNFRITVWDRYFLVHTESENGSQIEGGWESARGSTWQWLNKVYELPLFGGESQDGHFARLGNGYE